MNEKFAIVGLGYVGLPVAMAFAEEYPNVVGFDIDSAKVVNLRNGLDLTLQFSHEEMRSSRLELTSDPESLRQCTFFIVSVPTPIDSHKRPDLQILQEAAKTVGKAISRGSVVVFESTVYPGVTEEVCVPILEQHSGLKVGHDFNVGYSPERINPGDREHTFRRIKKVVSGDSPATLDRLANAYAKVVTAGIYRAESIKVAEAAKVIENTQRDLNIALMNELAIIFDKLGINTRDVLKAAGTKWNFLSFSPGLVGGHCVGVDPYYLTSKAEQLGYYPEVILAGRKINDGMGAFIAQKVIKLLISQSLSVKGACVGILGLTFKEDVPDLRNSRIPGIADELRSFGIKVMVHDPLGSPEEALREYGIEIVPVADFPELDCLILAVPHKAYLERGISQLLSCIKANGVFVDVKSVFAPNDIPAAICYWRL